MVKKKISKGFAISFNLKGKRGTATPSGKPLTKAQAQDLKKRMTGVGLRPRIIKFKK